MKSVSVKYGDPAPFECYLLVNIQDYGELLAFQVLDILDIDVLLQKALEQVYYGYGVQLETCRQNGGSNYACIITDSDPIMYPATPHGRGTDSVIVWDSCDFYYTLDGGE